MAEFSRFSQQDPQWKSKLLGFDNESTLGGYGCLLTSITMASSVYGFTETPDSLNEKMKSVGGFQGSFIIPAMIGRALPGILYRNYLDCSNQPAPIAEIDAYLGAGKPVIVEVDYSPKAGLQNHWIVIYAKKGEDYLIQDPWPSPVEVKEITLTTRFGFAGKPAQVINKVLFLDGPSGTVTLPPPPKLDTNVVASFKVYAMAGELAIRSQTIVSDATLIKRVPINTEFSVLEKDDVARAKIGQINQWLPIKAADGTMGFVAAWYVNLNKQTLPSIPPPPAASTSAARPSPAKPAGPVVAKPVVNTPSVVVKTTSEGVALRSKPKTTAATLIKRMPFGTELKVFGSEDDARRKVGVMNEWLKVKDVTGTEGVVAAWYVTLGGKTAIGVKNQTPAATPSFDVMVEIKPVLLRAAQEGLALRSAPVIMAQALIKRLPANAELIAIEPPEMAASKVGKVGEWIHVRDVVGEEGYCAAWYVVERPADPALVAGPLDS